MAPSTFYQQAMLQCRPSAYFPLNDPTGATTAQDLSENGQTGSILGGVVLQQPGAMALGDKAMTFDGSTGYISVPATAALQCNGDWSLVIWANETGVVSGYPALMAQGSGEVDYGWLLWTQNGNTVAYKRGLADGTSYQWPVTGFALVGQQAMVVFTYDSATLTLTAYQNGTPVDQTTLTTGFANNADPEPLTLGVGGTGGGAAQHYWNGTLGEAAVWDRCLSPDAVQALFQAATALGAAHPTAPIKF